MWNCWLDFKVDDIAFEKEIIEGGRLNKDPYYFALIKNASRKAGFIYVDYVSQNNGQPSLAKKMNPTSVFSGQLILTFLKSNTYNPNAIIPPIEDNDAIKKAMYLCFEKAICTYIGASIEQIVNTIQENGIKNDYIDKLPHKLFTKLLQEISQDFSYEEEDNKYYFYNRKFKYFYPTNLKQKARYFLVSHVQKFKKMKDEDLIKNIYPLIMNGYNEADFQREIKNVKNEYLQLMEGYYIVRKKKDNQKDLI